MKTVASRFTFVEREIERLALLAARKDARNAAPRPAVGLHRMIDFAQSFTAKTRQTQLIRRASFAHKKIKSINVQFIQQKKVGTID